MQSFFFSFALSALVAAAPSEYLHTRAVGDSCRAPEGTGSCEPKSSCLGISYPTAVCPNDPDDVQVRRPEHPIPLVCSLRAQLTMLKQCCVTAAPVPEPVTAAARDLCTSVLADTLVFDLSISDFVTAKQAKNPSCFDWSDDGCSCSPDEPGEFNFLPPCWRHDFGYRNNKALGRFDDALKERIDNQFHDDLYDVCNKYTGLESYKGVKCRALADIYVAAVKAFGRKKRDGVVGEKSAGMLDKRDCDIFDRMAAKI